MTFKRRNIFRGSKTRCPDVHPDLYIELDTCKDLGWCQGIWRMFCNIIEARQRDRLEMHRLIARIDALEVKKYNEYTD